MGFLTTMEGKGVAHSEGGGHLFCHLDDVPVTVRKT